MNNIDDLKPVITKSFDCDCRHLRTSRIHQIYDNETVWKGKVETFELIDHPKAKYAYAWSWIDDDGETQHTTVLGVPPVNMAGDAVTVAIASGQQE